MVNSQRSIYATCKDNDKIISAGGAFNANYAKITLTSKEMRIWQMLNVRFLLAQTMLEEENMLRVTADATQDKKVIDDKTSINTI